MRENLDRRLRTVLALPAGDVEAAERLPVVVTRLRILLELGRCEEATALLEAEVGRFRGPGRGRLERLAAAVAVYVERGTKPEAPELRPFFRNASPCAVEGIRLLTSPLRDLEERLKAPWVSPRTDRAVQLSADALLAAARRARVEEEAAGRVAALEGRNAAARATLAALRVTLGADAHVLGDLLAAPDAPGFVEALRETGRRRLLARYLDAAGRAAVSESKPTRLALADAAALDGSRAALALVLPLLLDPVPDVRIAAATAFVRHFPDEIAAYDPAGTPAARRAVVEKLEALLER